MQSSLNLATVDRDCLGSFHADTEGVGTDVNDPDLNMAGDDGAFAFFRVSTSKGSRGKVALGRPGGLQVKLYIGGFGKLSTDSQEVT